MARHAIVGRDFPEIRLELLASLNVDLIDFIRNSSLFAEDGDFVPGGRRPIIEIDHDGALPGSVVAQRWVGPRSGARLALTPASNPAMNA